MTEQKQFLDVIDVALAKERFRAAVSILPLSTEQVPLAESLGRVLADNVSSDVNVPSFDRSNFDGYALLASDTHGASEERPIKLQLINQPIRTATVPDTPVGKGLAIPISTGAMLPRGADAVLMIEDADVSDGALFVRRGIASGFGVSFAGTDISLDELVLVQGETITSREAGVLAAIGIDEVSVYRRPKVAVISTGDEIIPPGTPMKPGLVYDSNARIIAETVRELNAEPLELGIAIDDEDELRRLLRIALEQADVIVLSGGTSKGEGDLSYRVVEELNDPGIVVHGVALKPGKPICLAASGGKPIAILPGFPTSAIFTFHEFVAPLIRRLGGSDGRAHSQVEAQLSVRLNSMVGRTEYVLVGLVPAMSREEPDSEGQPGGTHLDTQQVNPIHQDANDWHAFPMGKGSGSVTTFSHADGFITIDRHREIIEAGSRVTVQLLARDLQPADLVIMGSHCVGLDYLRSLAQRRGFTVKFIAVGSMGGIDAVRREQCDIAGIHLLDDASGAYNRPFIDERMELVKGYRRRQGLIHRDDDARFAGKDLEELARMVTSDNECVMMNRNAGSGTRLIIDRFLKGDQPAGYSVQARNHPAVAAAVSQHRADWGIAIEQVTKEQPLGFVPLQDEEYDFVIPKKRLKRAPLQAFLAILQDSEVRQELERRGCMFSGGVESPSSTRDCS